jgi:hypothetical protein
MNNPAREPITRCGTTIDAVFSRYLENITSKIFVIYFSFHRPIVTFVQSKNASTASETEVTDEMSNYIL